MNMTRYMNRRKSLIGGWPMLYAIYYKRRKAKKWSHKHNSGPFLYSNYITLTCSVFPGSGWIKYVSFPSYTIPLQNEIP